mgnify:CR=1 FL=1|tara:strand:- start:1557 stop:2246 length:690 start_codon:yes stop_codon:yes gene_type:complete
MTSPLIIALDLDLNSAISLTKQLDPKDCQLKIGHQLFTSEGPKCIKRFQEMGFKIFLDLKYHDIPNTVFSAVSSAIDLGVWMINIHSSGGPEMIKAAVKAREESKQKDTLLLGVTILTSLEDSLLKKIGFKNNTEETVKKLALLSKENGLNGVVCSPKEAGLVKLECGSSFITVTPGIRQSKANEDQRRVDSAKEALMKGSDYIVVGRSITQSPNPVKSTADILEEINS